MKISIAMATYNGAKYIDAQLQSFVVQIRRPDELVITDDCSTDATEAIVRDFAKSAPFKVVFSRNEQNLGYCGNFNAALMQTTGDLVFLSDQDDVWYPDKIATISELAEKHPDTLVIMNDAALTDANLNEVGLTKLGQIRSAGFSMESFVMGSCCAVRRELLDLCMPIPEQVNSHDNWLVGFAQGLDAQLISDKVLQFYRRHESNESQFIANRTTKVTKWDRYRESLVQNLTPSSETVERQRILQSQLFLEGIDRGLARNTATYSRQLKAMQTKTRAVIVMMEKRLEIRRRKFPARLAFSLIYWLNGGYRQAKGLQSAVRDMLG